MFEWIQEFHTRRRVHQQRTYRSARGLLTTHVLVEVVGAMRLRVTNDDDIDPFVVVKSGGVEVHRTKPVTDDGNPIWTIKTGSLFVLDIPHEDCPSLSQRHLVLPPKDDDDAKDKKKDSKQNCRVNGDDRVTIEIHDNTRREPKIGSTQLRLDDILDMATNQSAQRLEFPIVPAKGFALRRATLALRFRLASREDLKFMGVLPPDNAASVRGEAPSLGAKATDLMFKEVRIKNPFQSYYKVDRGAEYYRVLPGPCPSRPKQDTEWMTKPQIEQEVLQTSHKWVHAGHGTAGTLFVEILSCDHLPNMDMGAPNDKTDPFVSIVFEDSVVRTDMLWDILNPRWMPWTMRAFAFRVRHPTSPLFVGVFDYDEGPLDKHDPIGKVVIDIANLYPSTSYVLQYRLQHDPKIKPEEEERGTIRLRVRVEWEDSAIQHYYEQPERCIINCKTDKSYQVVRYLTRGHVDMENSSMESIRIYLSELGEMWLRYCHFLDIMFEVLLWRGQVDFSKHSRVWFPYQSLILFVCTVLVFEYPNLALPMYLYGIAIMLLTINYHNSRHPNPWKQVMKMEELNAMVLFHTKMKSGETVLRYQGFEDGKVRDKLDEVRRQRMATLISETLTFLLRVYRIYSTTSVSPKFFSTKQSEWSLLSGKLYYPHMMLRLMVKYARLYVSFINWNSNGANGLVIRCVVLATLLCLVPVNTILFYVAKTLAWVFLGPWMILVDKHIVHKWYKRSDELEELIRQGVEPGPDLPDFLAVLNSEVFVKMSHSGRLVVEDAVKLRDMREHLFGHYSETIPTTDASRYQSIPLPASTAEPYNPPPTTLASSSSTSTRPPPAPVDATADSPNNSVCASPASGSSSSIAIVAKPGFPEESQLIPEETQLLLEEEEPQFLPPFGIESVESIAGQKLVGSMIMKQGDLVHDQTVTSLFSKKED